MEERAFFATFSANTEYKTVEEMTAVHGTKFVSTIARCNVYRASIKPKAIRRLSTDFMQAVNSLPLDNFAPYLHLISFYGTHYVNTVVMGSKAIIRSEFDKTGWSTMENEGIKVGEAAGASFEDDVVKASTVEVSYVSTGTAS